MFHCATESDWERLAGSDGAGCLGRVAVIVQLEAALSRRALAMGVGVVRHDTSTDIMAQVIETPVTARRSSPCRSPDVRRRLQSAYLELGGDDRTGAIRVIERDGLLDGDVSSEPST